MGGHEKSGDRAQRRARADLSTLGRELREARLNRGLSQGVAAQAIGVSPASWSRLERGEAPGVSLVDVARALAVVGLDHRVRAYPGGQPVRDQAHLQLLRRIGTREPQEGGGRGQPVKIDHRVRIRPQPCVVGRWGGRSR